MFFINNKGAKDIFATLINQIWRLVSGPVIMLLIPLFLTETQQGYWFLFTSLSALSICRFGLQQYYSTVQCS